MAAQDPNAPVVIRLKKYGNRRLYDTHASTYVTLAEVEAMLQRGDDIEVVDAKSGADLTKSVLVQIISEREASRDVLPLPFLKHVVRLGGNQSAKEQFGRFLGESISNMVEAQRTLANQMQELARRAYSQQPTFFNPFAPFAQPPPGPAQAAPPASAIYGQPPTAARDPELAELKAELHETQTMVKALLKQQLAQTAGTQGGESVEAPESDS